MGEIWQRIHAKNAGKSAVQKSAKLFHFFTSLSKSERSEAYITYI
jgi:hypothetical protein